MAYASWSVIAGEQPTAAKWNILGTNDSSFNDGTGIGSGKILTGQFKPYSFYSTWTITSPSPAGATTVFTNNVTYTSGPTAETVFVWWTANGTTSGIVGSAYKLVLNGAAVGDISQADGPATTTRVANGYFKFTTAATTANTLALQITQAAGAQYNHTNAYIMGFAVSNA